MAGIDRTGGPARCDPQTPQYRGRPHPHELRRPNCSPVRQRALRPTSPEEFKRRLAADIAIWQTLAGRDSFRTHLSLSPTAGQQDARTAAGAEAHSLLQLQCRPMSKRVNHVDFDLFAQSRFAPDSDRKADVPGCPKGAVSSTDQRNTYLKPRTWSDGDEESILGGLQQIRARSFGALVEG